MYENKFEPLASQKIFLSRVLKSFFWSVILLTFSLFLGMVGYYTLGGLSWIEAFLNASMILGGMGPIDKFDNASDDAKLFGGLYAIYCGVVFLTGFAIIIAPFVHRFLHKFHIEGNDNKD